MMSKCVECGIIIGIINREQGAIVQCPECGIELEIAGNALIERQLDPGPLEE